MNGDDGKKQKSNVEFYEKEADESGHLYFARYEVNENDEYAAPLAHFHDSVEFVIVREGEYIAHVGAQEKVLSAGEIAFIDSFVPHFYRTAGKCVVYAVVADKNLFFENALSIRAFLPFFKLSGEKFDVVMRFFDACESYITRNAQTKAGFADMLAGLLYEFCPSQPRSENKTARTFSEVLKYLNVHYREEINLSSLAAEFSYAENYFSAMFNDFAGMSLREYINRRRIAEVMRLKAKNPEIPLFSLALDCGYVSEKTFYRAYARYGKK